MRLNAGSSPKRTFAGKTASVGGLKMKAMPKPRKKVGIHVGMGGMMMPKVNSLGTSMPKLGNMPKFK